MTYSELIQLYFERSGALQSYWTLYVVIIGGLLAFSSLRKEPDRLTTLLVSILFVCFAHNNLGAIHDATEQRLAVLSAIHEAGGDGGEPTKGRTSIEATLQPPEYEGVRNFHWTADVLTLLTLWAMERRRKRSVA